MNVVQKKKENNVNNNGPTFSGKPVDDRQVEEEKVYFGERESVTCTVRDVLDERKKDSLH